MPKIKIGIGSLLFSSRKDAKKHARKELFFKKSLASLREEPYKKDRIPQL